MESSLTQKKLVGQKLLRCGYTTGACAAAAAKAAVLLLLLGEEAASAAIRLPRGEQLVLEIAAHSRDTGSASCAVRKDGGDDPDITDGALVWATVRRAERGIEIDGGQGIGRVTKPGLDQPVGAAAINSVPRRMIEQAVMEAMEKAGYTGGLSVIISIPGGERLAARTFNPRLGIEGGLSVLGTSGIVEPMSNAALVETIRAELSMLAALDGEARQVLLTVGNQGADFAERELGLSLESRIKCGNFLGDAIAAAVERGFDRILIVGHLGKLVKLGIGLMNTHSQNGDGRIETLIACALQAGAGLELLRALPDCVGTEAALALLQEAGLLEPVMAELSRRIDDHLQRRLPPGREIAFICFGGVDGENRVLAQSANAPDLIKRWRTC